MPPFTAGDPHAALHLVDDIAGIVVDVEGAQLVGSEEALVLRAAVFPDKAVSASAEHFIVGFH
ncbi:hypothetical protein D3C85_1946260 [compost metagenome]